ncbi:SusC/RagA family TonB-linked outer membrane protein [Olivibacter sp. SDN3]|uniref:SusC/RagA family TonB-linked outer membrane protein n=1 Tax=Olivibacter sp. SDN3 TaxID=2764720 RepID=UPI00165172D9|nr:SusC/RagA family TonB-linked outer membrane protein [Olivibacter sp. SDN3]QNL52007.1 SusC/RagA family TonB-linked outer membrane protein [Olivibacter sp. SDN3]
MNKNALFIRQFMRTTILIYTTLLAFSQLLLAETSKGQILGKPLNISFTESTLYTVIQQLQEQSDAEFAFDESTLKLEEIPVGRQHFQSEPLAQILDKLLLGTDIGYRETGRGTIVLQRKQPSGKVSGRILDEQGEPLAGASIRIQELGRSVSSDGEGYFSLTLPPGSYTFDVSYIAYQAQQQKDVTVASGANVVLDFTLKDNIDALNEVVVVGYGKQKLANLTGSVSAIDKEMLERRPIVSTSAALQGIAPGVTVTTQSGSPGADGGQIRIRGVNSFGGSDSSPLVLIDGIPGNIDLVDINLIESVSVLKDAASAAIYGSRAANGVIMITTKRATEDRFMINYRGYGGWQEATRIPEVTDGLTFMRVFNEANMNDNGYVLYSDEAIEEFRQRYAADPENFDWQKAILNGSGFTNNHFVSLAANSGKIRVMPSLSYADQGGIIKNTGFKRYILRNNMDVDVNDKLTLKLDMALTNSDRLQIANEGTIWNYLGRMPTNIPIRRNGNWSEGWVNNNPVAFIDEGGNRKVNNIEFFGNLNITYKPATWLSLTGIVAPRYQTRNTHNFVKSVMTYNDDGTEAGAANTFTALTETGYRYYFGNYQFLATASKEWADHTFKFLLGASRETYDEKYLMGYRRDFTYDTYEVLTAGADNETKDNDGTHAQWLLVSTFGRFNYDYKDRYLFEANFRYDGTSRFINKNRWAFFPSFSAAWRLSEEPFMANTKQVVNQLKWRASWGKLGNQNIGSSYYPFTETLAVGSISMAERIYQLVTLNTMANPDLRWEETGMVGVGLDATLFKKWSFTADWYRKNTDGILLTLYTSQLTGLNAPYQNAAKVRNTGWEFATRYDNQWGDFNLGVGLNISDVKNVITDMKGQTSGTLLRQQEGYPVNSIYGYLADGLYQSQDEIDAGPTQFGSLHPGDIRYRDLAGAFDANGNPIPDGRITDEDRTVIGSTIPRYTYGMQLDLGWKGFRLNAMIQGVAKVDGYLNSHYVIPAVNSSAIKPWQLDYWTEDNREASFPRVSITSTNNTQNSSFWMRSAAYMRLKNLQIGYALPKNMLSKFGISDLYLYVNGQNLFTLTDFWQGYDPEIAYDPGAADGVSLGGGAYYPQVKVYSFGIDVKF